MFNQRGMLQGVGNKIKHHTVIQELTQIQNKNPTGQHAQPLIHLDKHG